MKRLNLFRRFDPRLARELKSQRKLILAGLACVAVTSVLTSATIPLTKVAVNAIADAAPVRTEAPSLSPLPAQGETLADAARRLGVAEADLRAALRGQSPESAAESAVAVQARQTRAIWTLFYIALAVIGLFTIKYWFTRGQTYFLSQAASRLASDLRIRLFDKLQRLPVSYYNRQRAGAIQSVLTNDVSVYQTAVTIVRDSIDGPIKAISAFVMIFVLQWQLALVAMLFMPVMAAVIQRNGRKMRTAQRDVQNNLSSLNAMTQEALQGTRIVKAFNAESVMSERYSGLVERQFESQMVATRRLASLRPLVEWIGAATLAVVLFLCGYLATQGRLRVGDLAALVIALDVVNQGFRNLGSVNNTYNQVQAASERIYSEVLEVPEEQVDLPGARTLEAPSGRLEFRNVSFAYPDGTEALRNVSFTLEPGTSLALVGPSGAGKSTIADLVLRFYDPTEGQILFDGVDVRELKVGWLREQIGVVPQQTFLFAGSLRENLLLGAPEATDAELHEAAVAAHADGFVGEMGGLSAEIGERGVGLSGGQMQRVAIARALVRKPALLLLDEATSALDAESEKHVQRALDEIMRERTTLFIAHRLTTAARADRILVLRRGEVVELGSHRELMERDGSYAAMVRMFSAGLSEEIV